MTTLKLKLCFMDRVGIVADVANCMARHDFNILSMEVRPEGRRSLVYLEARGGGSAPSEARLHATLKAIPDLEEIRSIYTLPHEKRESRYRVVLDSVSDGIVAVDEQGRLTIMNHVAREILNCRSRSVIGMRVADIGLADDSILECLAGKSFTNVRRNIITERGRFQCVASGRPIKDASGRIVGAVEVMKDMKEIRALVSAVSQPAQVGFSDIIGRSPAIRAAISLAQKIADSDAIVSIRGASGTGKELFARAIHHDSGRKGPFVPINCAALPESLLESELFGYVGGAFTGAQRQGKPGLFEVAHGGSIFLDEIGELPPGPQAKILRLIQEKRLRRIGGAREIPVDARIVTATNRNLEQMVESGRFREDLYYRINVLPIHIPPLRRRPEDLQLLVEHFVFQLNAKLGRRVEISDPAVFDKLTGHDWPGNVRELKNVIERAAILAADGQITANTILFGFEVGQRLQAAAAFQGETPDGDLPRQVRRYEKQLLVRALAQCTSLRQTARRLNISHTTLRNKIKKHGLRLEIKRSIGNIN